MRRRDFIALGSAAAAWSIEARAQHLALPVVGFLGSDSPELYADRLRAFRRGLKDAGYVESENIVIEYRWANGDNNRLPMLAAEFVDLRVNVLVWARLAPFAGIGYSGTVRPWRSHSDLSIL
jgi:putative tryptophan/tyrosine transport system substrate-binding protein